MKFWYLRCSCTALIRATAVALRSVCSVFAKVTLLVVSASLLQPLFAAELDEAELSRSRALSEQGRAGDALEVLRNLERSVVAEEGFDPRLRSELLLEIGELYESLGDSRQAVESLQSISDTGSSSARVLDRLGQLWMRNGSYVDAVQAFELAVAGAQTEQDDDQLVQLLNQRAVAQAALAEYADAARDLRAAIDYLPAGSDAHLEAQLNLVRMLLEEQSQRVDDHSSRGAAADNLRNAQLHEILAQLTRRLLDGDARFDGQRTSALIDLLLDASHLDRAAQIETADYLARPEFSAMGSFQSGYRGELLHRAGRYQQAFAQAEEALRRAQNVGRPEVTYRWEWLLARILRDVGEYDEAQLAYQQAIDTLAPVQMQLLNGNPYRFRETVGQIYFEFADFILTHRLPDNNGSQNDKMLIRARGLIENLKVAELQDYLGEDCTRGIKQTPVDTLEATTAVVYPIVLADRTEILVSHEGSVSRSIAAIGRRALRQRVLQFRSLLTDEEGLLLDDPDFAEEEMLREAGELYDVLLAQMVRQLPPEVETLVFVPDGALRLIPMEALHDGDGYLVERFNVAVIPSLNLTDSKSPESYSGKDAQIYLGGVSESRTVQTGRLQPRKLQFASLASVPKELERIGEILSAPVQLNEPFMTGTLEQELSVGDYSIVHIASHGIFNRDPDTSFILTWDRYLSMNRISETLGLRRYQSAPIDLLVLSACQTAEGDERAALGLAGVAVSAGARSAVASLWEVVDLTTARMMTDFYEELLDKDKTKAQALREAKLKLINDPVFSHPLYWAPFLLIGNWQ